VTALGIKKQERALGYSTLLSEKTTLHKGGNQNFVNALMESCWVSTVLAEPGKQVD
jgi:hypothetical protein